jgi:hypothetical protein
VARLSELIQRGRFRWSYARAARRTRIVLSAGMPRSGSTWLYNAARLLLSSRDEPSCGWIDDWARLPVGRVMLIKVHAFDPFLARGAGIILYSYRDVRDALASSKRCFGVEPSVELARQWLDADRQWRARADFVMRYESMLADPRSVVGELARVVNISPIDPDEILEQLAQLDCRVAHTGAGGYDVETLLHPGHITDGRHGSWDGWLSPALLREIEDECADWLTANEYAVPATVY